MLCPHFVDTFTIRYQNKPLKYDKNTNTFKLNSGVDVTFGIYDDESIYNNNIGRICIVNKLTKTTLRHSNFVIRCDPYSAGIVDFAFKIVKRNNNLFDIYNDFTGNFNYKLIYDIPTDKFIIGLDNNINLDPTKGFEIIGTINTKYIVPDLALYPNKVGVYTLFKTLSYTGPILNIRRNSDNVSLDFYCDEYGNILTSLSGGQSLSTWLNGSIGFVKIWYDQSGNNKHATQTDITLQPIIDLTTLKNSIYFKGNSYLKLPDNTIPCKSPYTIICNHGIIGNSIGTICSSGIKNTNKSNNIIINNSSYINSWFGNDININSNGLPLQNKVVFTYNGNGTTSGTRMGYINNKLILSKPSTNQISDSINNTIGSSTSSENLNGNMYYLYIFNNNLSLPLIKNL